MAKLMNLKAKLKSELERVKTAHGQYLQQISRLEQESLRLEGALIALDQAEAELAAAEKEVVPSPNEPIAEDRPGVEL